MTETTTQYATEKQIAFGDKAGLTITAETERSVASEMIQKYVTANPLSDEEQAARKEARKARLLALPASDKQKELVSRITKGKFVPVNQWQAQGFFGARRNRRVPAAA